MTTPIQFSSQEAFEEAVGAYFRKNLSFNVSTRTDSVDVGIGNYVQIKTHKVFVELGGETFTEFDLD